VSFSVSFNTLNFETPFALDFKISLETLLTHKEYARAFKRERERDDDDDSDDDFILLLLFVLKKVAPLLFYVFVFKVVLVFEKKEYESRSFRVEKRARRTRFSSSSWEKRQSSLPRQKHRQSVVVARTTTTATTTTSKQRSRAVHGERSLRVQRRRAQSDKKRQQRIVSQGVL
jgi:hypothetical protein